MGTLPQRSLPNILITGTPGTGAYLLPVSDVEKGFGRLSSLLSAAFPVSVSTRPTILSWSSMNGPWWITLYFGCVREANVNYARPWRGAEFDPTGDRPPPAVATNKDKRRRSVCLIVGKTTTSELVAEATGYRNINVGEWVSSQSLHSGWDQKFEAHIIDEDKVCDAMEDQLAEGGNVVDYHSCDFFPERWFDLVIVLQTDNSLLYERLQKRHYSLEKITENVECEIMHVVVEEARESYREEIVQVLPSNTVEDMDGNVERIVAWVNQVTGKQ